MICVHGIEGEKPCPECETISLRHEEPERFSPLQRFAFDMGQLLGGLERQDIRDFLAERGVSPEQTFELHERLRVVARAFYK